MKKILGLLSCCFVALTMVSCLDASVDDDNLGSVATAEEIAANLDVHGITPGSNKVILKNNNKGIAGMWDYLAGVTTSPCDTVLIPFTGEQTLKFYATCGGGQVLVEKKVTIDKIDYPLDPCWFMLAGEGGNGKTWKWDPQPGRGALGCYGSGGYGWSADVPNWGGAFLGETVKDGPKVDANEWITFDLKGGANATLHKADGTEVKGTFSLTMGTSSAKAALKPKYRDGTLTGKGWVGTLQLKGVTLPAGFIFGTETASSGNYDLAVFSDHEMVLIEPNTGSSAILCDPAWATSSTHWCLVSE